VLNNSAYVPQGKSVVDYLKEKTNKVFNFAKDGATIQDCYAQLDKIPLDFNNTNTYVFISVGGNDILNNRSQLNNAAIDSLFSKYVDFIDVLKNDYAEIEMISRGSSLKFCLVAEGSADCYPRFAPTMEWDTAAGHAICKFAGFTILDLTTKAELLYNKENLLNNFFLVEKSTNK
jgi:hypothetical protein